MATEESIGEGDLRNAGVTEPPRPAEAHRQLLSVDRSGGAGADSSHILVPVDDTDDSEAAIDFAISNFKDSTFHLLHVVPEPQMVHIWAGAYIPPDDNAELVEVEDTKLFVSHRFARKLMTAGIPFKLHVVVGPTDSDSIACVILSKAKDLPNCTAIVMARHSKGALKELWVGSVTKQVVKDSPVPVAVVPFVGGKHDKAT